MSVMLTLGFLQLFDYNLLYTNISSMGSECIITRIWNYRWYHRRIDNDCKWKNLFAFRTERI